MDQQEQNRQSGQSDHGERYRDGQQNAFEPNGRVEQIRQDATENARRTVQSGIEAASHGARKFGDEVSRTLGMTGEEAEELARKAATNMEAVTQCGTVLVQASQDATRHWFGLFQSQMQRNIEGLNRLAQARSVQEFQAVQSDLMRDGLKHMIQDSKAIAEISVKAVEKAGTTIQKAA